ncbi:GyrI-like domain-containing protein [Pseudalkalibacillus sp. A8]|uniref:GyrI-like domain-containing protein n=1 Tax=Pseudalkalibacillus sp. A8 TaxID=3382641 RepID=UPI0038B5F69B
MSNTITKSKVIKRNGFSFIGSSIRTSNEVEMKRKGSIPQLWESFYENKVLDSITNKKDSTIVALYTNYESDETGIYTYAIGTEITDSEKTSEGLESFEIADDNYIVFTTRKGSIPEVVIEAWQEIWDWSEDRERAFKTDFEVYGEKAKDPQNSQVDIYISVK